MTTFADREHAIEAHYASQELAAFRERLHRCKVLGLQLAALAGLQGPDADHFALLLAERCASEASDEPIYHHITVELGALGLALSVADIRRMALTGRSDELHADIVPEKARSWVAFVTTELLSLFGSEPLLPSSALPAEPAV